MFVILAQAALAPFAEPLLAKICPDSLSSLHLMSTRNVYMRKLIVDCSNVAQIVGSLAQRYVARFSNAGDIAPGTGLLARRSIR